MKRFALLVMFCLTALPAFALPISYNAILTNNVAVAGEISPAASPTGTATAQYFSFYTDGGLQQVSITGTRIDYGYDMAMWILSGLYTDTDQLGPNFSAGMANFVAFRDDDVAPPGGFNGDPRFLGILGAGWYTVAVTNFASVGVGGEDNLFDFSLLATNIGGGGNGASIPEPTAMLLLGIGMLAMVVARRKG